MLAALERGVEGNRWLGLVDKVGRLDVLGVAWDKVSSNAGACGVDGITVGRFGKDSESRLLAVKERIMGGTYQPTPVRRVEVPKAGGGKRPLGIPTVADRVVQTALKMVLEPIFECGFAPSSYGFRPGRGCKDALREVEGLLREGMSHVVDVDIKGYFDNIPHDKLMRLVERRVADGKVLGLIERFLKSGVMEEGVVYDTELGSPQGGIISPLLANIYLDPLDWLLEGLGLRAVRYADDIVVLAESATEAARALEVIGGWTGEAGLELHPEKTRLVDMTEEGAHFDFLGYRFRRTRRGKLVKVVRPKSKQSLRARLRKKTRRRNTRAMAAVAAALNPVLEGWFAYFRHAHPGELAGIDGWVRMRLRSMLRKRNKKEGRGRGSDHQRWPNRYFRELGLFSLEEARAEHAGLLRGAKC